MPQTREHILLARQVGVPRLVVFLNKCDVVDDGEILDLIEMELRELLARQGFDAEATPFVRGAAIKALDGEKGALADEAILELFAALDSHIVLPERSTQAAFLMPIEGAQTISGRGTVVTGVIQRGAVRIGDEVEIVGLGETLRSVVTGVESFHKILDEGQAGDSVGCLLRGIERDAVSRGQVLASPGSIAPCQAFEAELHVLTHAEGGRHTPFFAEYSPQFYFGTTDVTGSVTLEAGVEMVLPGDDAKIVVALQKPVALEARQRFAVREGDRTVGAGVVTRICT
jgi:elongation factor Tu